MQDILVLPYIYMEHHAYILKDFQSEQELKKCLWFLTCCFSITTDRQTTVWVFLVSLSCLSCVSIVHVQNKGDALHLLNHRRFLRPLHSSFLQRFVQLGCSNSLRQGHDEYFRVSGPGTNTELVPATCTWLIQAGRFSWLKNLDRPCSESGVIPLLKRFLVAALTLVTLPHFQMRKKDTTGGRRTWLIARFNTECAHWRLPPAHWDQCHVSEQIHSPLISQW